MRRGSSTAAGGAPGSTDDSSTDALVSSVSVDAPGQLDRLASIDALVSSVSVDVPVSFDARASDVRASDARASNAPVSADASSPMDAQVAMDASIALDASSDVGAGVVGSIHTMSATGAAPDREFVTGKGVPERTSGELPRVPVSFNIRVCFVSTSGLVERVAVNESVERDNPAIGRVVRAVVLRWRYAPYPTAKRLVCIPVGLRANVTAAEFAAGRP
jgi:hypothetical protein